MDSTHFDLLLFQRQQLQCNVLDPLQRIKGAIGRSMQPREVDAVKALLNREVRNFVLAEVYDGQHLMEVFDLCYGQDNLKLIERLLEEADLQNISQMVRNWMSRNRRLVPNVFYHMRCKKVKSPLLSTQSLSSIYREKEQLLSKEELQESIRSAEIKEWEKLLDKAKNFIKAAKLGDEEEVQYLLNEGVDADYMNEFGQTALMIACREGHLQVVNVLITYSADLNIQDRFGKSALHEAAWSGKHQVIAPLVSKDADINAIDEEGRTPLQFAAIRGQTKVAEVLLLLGADPSILNKHGEAAVELAYKRRHKDIINLLLNSTNKEVRKNTRSQIRKLKIRHLKSATSLSKKRNL